MTVRLAVVGLVGALGWLVAARLHFAAPAPPPARAPFAHSTLPPAASSDLLVGDKGIDRVYDGEGDDYLR